jgi:hypothetical protein
MEVPPYTLSAGFVYRIVANSAMGLTQCMHRFIRFNDQNEPVFEHPTMGMVAYPPAYGWKFYSATL